MQCRYVPEFELMVSLNPQFGELTHAGVMHGPPRVPPPVVHVNDSNVSVLILLNCPNESVVPSFTVTTHGAGAPTAVSCICSVTLNSVALAGRAPRGISVLSRTVNAGAGPPLLLMPHEFALVRTTPNVWLLPFTVSPPTCVPDPHLDASHEVPDVGTASTCVGWAIHVICADATLTSTRRNRKRMARREPRPATWYYP